MKIKNYLFTLMVGITTFWAGFAGFSIWELSKTTNTKVEQNSSKLETQNKIKKENTQEIFPTTIITVEANPSADETQLNNVENQEEFDAEGYYHTEDKLPKELANFNYFHLTTSSDEVFVDYEGVPIPPKGYLHIGERRGKSYDLTQINLSNKKLAFASQKINGISYEFSGRFLTSKRFWNVDPKTIVLEGELIKLRKSKKVASVKLRFTWYGGC